MKKIAFLLFMVFAAVQAIPSVMAVFSYSTSVFIVDEEKGYEKAQSDDNKCKKDYTDCISQSLHPDTHLNMAFHIAEHIYSSPCLKKPAPPPNFC